MLDYNKIKSCMNFADSKKSELIRFIGINQSTFYDKLKRESFTPNELEKIADYFKKPIAYFFDKEKLHQVNEVDNNYKIIQIDCPECVVKQKEIDRLNEKIKMQEELLSLYREKKSKGKCG
jgi:hypothetical protein